LDLEGEEEKNLWRQKIFKLFNILFSHLLW
jgi:hypothetical protein